MIHRWINFKFKLTPQLTVQGKWKDLGHPVLKSKLMTSLSALVDSLVGDCDNVETSSKAFFKPFTGPPNTDLIAPLLKCFNFTLGFFLWVNILPVTQRSVFMGLPTTLFLSNWVNHCQEFQSLSGSLTVTLKAQLVASSAIIPTIPWLLQDFDSAWAAAWLEGLTIGDALGSWTVLSNVSMDSRRDEHEPGLVTSSVESIWLWNEWNIKIKQKLVNGSTTQAVWWRW